MGRQRDFCDVSETRKYSGSNSKYQSSGLPDKFDVDLNSALSSMASINNQINNFESAGASLGKLNFSNVPNVSGTDVLDNARCLSGTFGTNGSACVLNNVYNTLYNTINSLYNARSPFDNIDYSNSYLNYMDSTDGGTKVAEDFESVGYEDYYAALNNFSTSNTKYECIENDDGTKSYVKDNVTVTVKDDKVISVDFPGSEKVFMDSDNPYATLYHNSNIFVDYSDDGNLSFKRYNEETGEYNPISIFDDENLASSQYGANQEAFIKNFGTLIKDPYIWEELQKYYPVESFENEDKAMEFYQKYFTVMAHDGCGYAASANCVFKAYEGREEEFERTFGYPMYKVSPTGEIDFNYEMFQLGHYNYYNQNRDPEAAFLSLKVEYEQLLFQQEIDNIIKMNPELQKEKNPEVKVLMEEEKYPQLVNLFCAIRDDLDTLEQYDPDDYNLTARSGEQGKLGNIDEYLKTFGVDSIAAFRNYYMPQQNQMTPLADNPDYHPPLDQSVIADFGFDLYNMNGEFDRHVDGGHWMYVTDPTQENPIVSSWGNKYILIPSISEDRPTEGTTHVIVENN